MSKEDYRRVRFILAYMVGTLIAGVWVNAFVDVPERVGFAAVMTWMATVLGSAAWMATKGDDQE